MLAEIIWKTSKTNIARDDCDTNSDELCDFLANLYQRNIDNARITMPNIVCIYLKGPNIYIKKLESNNGLSFLRISKPPLISVPKLISISKVMNNTIKAQCILGGYLLSLSAFGFSK